MTKGQNGLQKSKRLPETGATQQSTLWATTNASLRAPASKLIRWYAALNAAVSNDVPCPRVLPVMTPDIDVLAVVLAQRQLHRRQGGGIHARAPRRVAVAPRAADAERQAYA